jgi:hypothetical protein
MRKPAEIQELAAEVVRRGHSEELIALSVPPTASERLQLLAAQLQGRPFVIWPKTWEILEEWLDYYAKVFASPDGHADLIEVSDAAQGDQAVDAEAKPPFHAC